MYVYIYIVFKKSKYKSNAIKNMAKKESNPKETDKRKRFVCVGFAPYVSSFKLLIDAISCPSV